MKKYFIGLLSIVLVLASILGAPSKEPKAQRDKRDSGPAMWV